MIRSTRALRDFVNAGGTCKYLFFWGHQDNSRGVSKTCFSQWYEARFTVDGITYPTAEHFMMAEKARLFDNEDIRKRILETDNPGAAKDLGRNVLNFDEDVWNQHRFDIVVRANVAKFSSAPDLKTFLLGTRNRVLVEASPTDRVWGIGLAADDPLTENPNCWKGLNLLGFALMEARQQLN